MTPYARMNLRDTYSPLITDSITKDRTLTIALTKDVRGEDKLGGIAELIQELINSGDILGCQVCVLENDQPIVDLSAGFQSPYDSRPVAPDTLFNCFSVTKGVAAGMCHLTLAT
jgi:CubicO group peptidase (beta-lactamase class C family)